LAAAAPLPDWSAAEWVTPPPPPTRERRSSWDDPDDARRAEPAPAAAPSHWDPLADPLPAGLDPLPEPLPAWSDAVSEPSGRWQADAVYVDPLPDAGTPLFDAASAFSFRPAEQWDMGTPLYDAASGPGRLGSAPDDGPDVGPDVGTPLFDAASAGTRRTADRNGHVTGVSGIGDDAGEPGRRSRRDLSASQQAYGTARPDLPRRTRRHGEPADELPSTVLPSAGRSWQEPADDARPGRRRASETPTSTGRHDADATSFRYRDDTPARHADPENRHAAPPGSVPRVPPTQWAWPKAESPSFDNPYDMPSGRRAADTGSTSWSAAELLETRHEGGRRRRGDATRHGRPADPDAGRHQR